MSVLLKVLVFLFTSLLINWIFPWSVGNRSAALAEHHLCGSRSWKGNGQNNEMVSSVTQVQGLKKRNLPCFFSEWKCPACEWTHTDFAPSLRGLCHYRKPQQTPNSCHSYKTPRGLEGWGIPFTSLAYFKGINIRDYHLHCATGTCQVNDCTMSVQRTHSFVQPLGCPWVLSSSFFF